MPDYHEINLLPEGRKIKAEAGKTLMENLTDHVSLRADCGGRGVCGKCRIIVETRDVPDLTDVEKDHLSPGLIASDWRVRCLLIDQWLSDCQMPDRTGDMLRQKRSFQGLIL